MSLFRLTLNDPIIRHKLFIKTGDKSDRLVTWDHIPDLLEGYCRPMVGLTPQ
ncbi:hypothetical protein [Calothrix sp. NIES-2100]|uniref:hypothetical protein n=1 Tax=Calothrix sp. NIES-2100 TaxID=1954172 RepID=UPI0030D9D9E9